MSNLAHIVETAALLALAYGVGAVVGLLMRRLFAWAAMPQSNAAPAAEAERPDEGQGHSSAPQAADPTATLAAPAEIGADEASSRPSELPGSAVPRLPARSVGSLFGSIEADLASERIIADDDARLDVVKAPGEGAVDPAKPSPVDQLLAELGREGQIAPAFQALEPELDAVLESAAVEARPVLAAHSDDAGSLEQEPVQDGTVDPTVRSETASEHEDAELAAMLAVEGAAPRRRRQG
ncbi:hypothetical protein SAMN02983003_0418 [Devosia enhydra]|uniref:Uncharacterized protein n=1 Tax=Devosia enhydra TaxID=665118 RepID=A0A1K2HTS8_9HYPH|nr:hypothetical protein [Devosia enhydra]SFZ81291.1 hypothetical protein SAMN02983003_0418 [Devosia enhydra]